MARLSALPLALVSMFLAHSAAFADGSHAKRVADPAKQPSKRPPTAMHTTPVAVPARRPAPVLATDPKATKGVKKPEAKPKPACLSDAVFVTRGVEEDRFSLTRCDGSVAPEAIAHMSILARPGSALRPTGALPALERTPGNEIAPGIRKLDPGLILRLQQIADHFRKVSTTPQKLHVISGYRPASAGSLHATGQAIDFRMDAVSNDELVAFCKTLPDTGCGYYPNSSFVHLDVRTGAGHVAWIDASGPGESARYVSTWPPPPEPLAPVANMTTKLDLPDLPTDEHPADVPATVPSAIPAPPVAAPTASNEPMPRLDQSP